MTREDKAAHVCADIYDKPTDERFEERIRRFQGCPTIAISRGGRVFAGWYSGGFQEPHMENYNLLVYSDDRGKTWSKPLLVIESSKPNFIHALDIQLWTDKDGALHVFWVQNNTALLPEVLPKYEDYQPVAKVDGYLFDDFVHSAWECVCENPDADEPIFSTPRCWSHGFLRCKPTLLANGDLLYFNYDQIDSRYGYSISADNGKSFEYRYGAEKIGTYFDECMAYQMQDGTVRMFARTCMGRIAESYSYDNARTWTEAKPTDIVSTSTRFFVSRTPSGNVLLVKNDHESQRTNLSAWHSDDDGKTWKYKMLIDSRDDISYPDVDFYDGNIFLVYDRERTGAKEILLSVFTEEDIKRGVLPWPVSVISRP